MTNIPPLQGIYDEKVAPGPNPKFLLSIDEVSEALGIGRSAVYQLLAQEELPVVRIGKTVRIPIAAIEAFIRRQSQGWYTRNPWQEPAS
jgi:excisionase family DNA binding protein